MANPKAILGVDRQLVLQHERIAVLGAQQFSVVYSQALQNTTYVHDSTATPTSVTAARARLQAALTNTVHPSPHNGGVSLDGGGDGLSFSLPTPNQVTRELSDDSRRITVSGSVSRKGGRLSMRVHAHSTPFTISDGLVDQLTGLCSHVSFEVVYSGVTLMSVGRRSVLSGSTLSISALFGERGTLLAPSLLVLTQPPVLRLLYSGVDEGTVRAAYAGSSIALRVGGLLPPGFLQQPLTVDVSTEGETVVVALPAPPASGTVPPRDREAHVLAVEASIPSQDRNPFAPVTIVKISFWETARAGPGLRGQGAAHLGADGANTAQ